MQFPKNFVAARRFGVLILLVGAITSIGKAQDCPGGSKAACQQGCSDQQASCNANAGTDLAVCTAGVNGAYDTCAALAAFIKDDCYTACQQQGANVQQCQIGCDQAYQGQLYGCQSAQVGGILGCNTAYQGEVNGCSDQAASCNANCQNNCSQ